MGGTPEPIDVMRPVQRALRPLGPHGEGWVGIQTAIAIAVLAAAPLDPTTPSATVPAPLTALGTAACIAGILLFTWGAVTLGPSFSVWVTPRRDARLVTSGPYRWTRHPICTAQAIFGFGWASLWASPIALVLAFLYSMYLDRFKLRREEETLLARYPEYAAYARMVTHRMWPVPPHRESAAPTPGVPR